MKQQTKGKQCADQSDPNLKAAPKALHIAAALTALGASLGLNPDTLLALPLDSSITSIKLDNVSFKFFKFSPIELKWTVDAVQIKIVGDYPSYLPLSYADSNPGIAVQFNLTETTILTGLQSSFLVPDNVTGYGSGNMLAAIYSDASGAPESELFKQLFAITGTGTAGPSGFALELGPGTYWAALELPQENAFSGFLVPGAGSSNFSINLQHDEESTPIPEPGSLILLATGMAAMLSYRKKKRRD